MLQLSLTAVGSEGPNCNRLTRKETSKAEPAIEKDGVCSHDINKFSQHVHQFLRMRYANTESITQRQLCVTARAAMLVAALA